MHLFFILPLGIIVYKYYIPSMADGNRYYTESEIEVHMEKWMIYSKKADFSALARRFSIDPVTARIIRNRDVQGEEAVCRYLYGTKKDMYSPWLFKDMEKAVRILKQKIEEGKKIRIIGDYDADGVNASCILLKGLKRCRAAADSEIPHRMLDGYGINERLIEEAYQAGIDTILTCDNGIAAMKQTMYAKSLGLTVIITDHHDVPYEETEGERNYLVPPADAVINAKQEDCPYPFKGLCGAGVAYKLVQALYESFGIPETEADELLEFAAVATIGDVMDLQDENRILVKEGLKRLRRSENPGLRALMQVNGIEPENLNSYHIGFIIAPCLNAGGRLDTAKRALELLLCENKLEADTMAGELKALNDSRKSLTLQETQKACDMLDAEGAQDKVLVVCLPECHESLAGIIAGKLRERYYRPVFVLTKAEGGLKGSGRSIEGYSMFEELVKCRQYLERFGGHPMAAGLSLKEDNLEALKKALNENCTLTPEDYICKRWIDVPMPLGYITKELIRGFSVLEPFGKGNEKPLFAEKDIRVLKLRTVGQNGNAVKLSVQDKSGCQMDAIYFGDAAAFMGEVQTGSVLSVLYYPSINEYRGTESLQITISGYRVQ